MSLLFKFTFIRFLLSTLWLLSALRNSDDSGQDVVAQIDELFLTKTKDEWVEVLQQHDVWHTVVAKVDDM